MNGHQLRPPADRKRSKIGAHRKDPVTGEKGEVVALHSQVTVCRTVAGRVFCIPLKRKRKNRYSRKPAAERKKAQVGDECLIRFEEIPHPLKGVLTQCSPSRKALVTEDHPVMRGAEVTYQEAQIIWHESERAATSADASQ